MITMNNIMCKMCNDMKINYKMSLVMSKPLDSYLSVLHSFQD